MRARVTQLRARAGPGWAAAVETVRLQRDSSPSPRRHEHQAGYLQVSALRRGALSAAGRPGGDEGPSPTVAGRVQRGKHAGPEGRGEAGAARASAAAACRE